jgi:predicted ATP-grasp superfamily ATP-dependent carboligase
MAIGAADPGQILLPTSDQTAWLYTVNAASLRPIFGVYQPSIDTVRTILDKKRLSDAAACAGLHVLPMWDPRNIDQVADLAPTLPYPIVIKPRTHVNRRMNNKGIVVRSKDELGAHYQQYIDRERYMVVDDEFFPDASRPILQQFVSVAAEGIISITGFSDRTGELFVTRRSTKLLQRLGPLGVGVCFESLPPDEELSSAVRKLCRALNYFGIFEVEFLRFKGRWAAIDFNPRIFSQIGLDIFRGMPLPVLACLDAAGEKVALKDAVEKAKVEDRSRKAVFFDRFTLSAILLAQTLTGRISPADRARWRNWAKQHAENSVDFAAAADDPMPGIVHALSETYLGLKAIRRFLRSTPYRSTSSLGFTKAQS